MACSAAGCDGAMRGNVGMAAYVGKVTLFLEETKVMNHPQNHAGNATDLYVRVSLGEQVWRTHKIANSFHEVVLRQRCCREEMVAWSVVVFGVSPARNARWTHACGLA